MAIKIESIERDAWKVELNGKLVGSIRYRFGRWRGYVAFDKNKDHVCEYNNGMHPTWNIQDFLNECAVSILAARAGADDEAPPAKKTVGELVMELEGFANAGAEGDLRFAGDEALKSMVRNTEHRAKLRAAMLLFAQTSASRVVKELARRGFLNTEKVKIR